VASLSCGAKPGKLADQTRRFWVGPFATFCSAGRASKGRQSVGGQADLSDPVELIQLARHACRSMAGLDVLVRGWHRWLSAISTVHAVAIGNAWPMFYSIVGTNRDRRVSSNFRGQAARVAVYFESKYPDRGLYHRPRSFSDSGLLECSNNCGAREKRKAGQSGRHQALCNGAQKNCPGIGGY